MTGKKKIREEIDSLRKSVEELSEAVRKKELDALREESRRFSETLRLLSDVKLKVKSVTATDDIGNGECVMIKYETPSVILHIDADGMPSKDPFFYATNMLDMLDINDIRRIQKVLDDVKNKHNKK